MKTYNDFMNVNQSESDRLDFIKQAISEHKASEPYRIAVIAEEYFRKQNVTIREYEKFLYTLEGRAVHDNFSPNFKIASGFFKRFITQENSFLLGNGVKWMNPETAGRLGTKKKSFDSQLQILGEKALIEGVAFGFFNKDHIEVFPLTEFVPLIDEEDGTLKAGIRFWQIAPNKPVRATLYELDGYTEFIWNEKDRNGDQIESNGRILNGKRSYQVIVRHTEIDGDEISPYSNYDGFPIVPLWANKERQSELIGLREQIDCYDLIKSGFANNVDDASIIYWLINGAMGMDDIDAVKFLDRVKTVHAVITDEETATAEPRTIDYPFAARDALLTRLERDLYKDAMAVDTDKIASGGAVTATQIMASYTDLNLKTDGFDYECVSFINEILELAGINDEPTFDRSYIVNTSEMITNVIQASPYLGEEYTVKKLLSILGDIDQTEQILNSLDTESLSRMVNQIRTTESDMDNR